MMPQVVFGVQSPPDLDARAAALIAEAPALTGHQLLKVSALLGLDAAIEAAA